MNQGFFFRLDQGVIPPPGGPVKSRLAVRAIVLRNGLLLMVHSAVLGDYKFPGGGVQPRETPEEALAREVLEETGYETVGRLRPAGRALERAEGRDVPGSLFEMESRYYYADVEDEPGDLQLEGYEKELKYAPVWLPPGSALSANRALASKARTLPWLERETRVLEILTEANS